MQVERIVERHEKWEPVAGITTPAARAVVQKDHEGLLVTMMFSEIVDGLGADLQMRFGRVAAYTVYEEFVHPSETPETKPPMLGERWNNYIFPLLVVNDSEWVRSLSDRLIGFPDSVHYRLLTLDQIVDVLCNKQPEVSWVKRVER